ncbi:MAG: hypothetical protein ACI4MM_08130 [Candidatus Ventricola sp.]
MARLTALRLRDRAREAVLAAGGRGFVRFLPAGGALLATDAIRRCAEDAARTALADALAQAGFVCEVRGGLLELTPADEVLFSPDCGEGMAVDWESPLHPAQALAVRFLAKKRQPLTAAGRQLVMETLRLTWQTPDRLLSGLPTLRAQAAVMQRKGDLSGLHEAGALLREFCEQED